LKQINLIVHGFIGKFGSKVLEASFSSYEVGNCISLCRYKKEVPWINANAQEWWGPGMMDTLDWSAMRPIDEEMINKMWRCERIVLEMMTRKEDLGRTMTYAQRKQHYLRLLQCWNHILEEKDIHLFLAFECPHYDHTYVLYELCKLKGISVLFFDPVDFFLDTVLLVDDWEDACPQLKEEYGKLLVQYANKSVDLCPRLEEYVRSQTEEGQDARPWCFRATESLPVGHRAERRLNGGSIMKLVPKLLKRVRNILRWSHIKVSLSRWFAHKLRKRSAEKTFRLYHHNAGEPDLSKKYIYFPLHMQPELSTCPLGGAYVDQALVAQMLNALLPKDVLIYIKEHPRQLDYYPDGTYRDISFYQDLLACDRVRLMPLSYDTFTLCKNSLAVAVVSGSAGFEALFREKPVLMFGHWFYQYASGVFPVRSTEDCHQALDAILNKGEKPSMHDVLVFLKAIENIAIEGSILPHFLEASRLTEEQNVKNISEVLAGRLKEEFGEE
jgi:hypothetical protein